MPFGVSSLGSEPRKGKRATQTQAHTRTSTSMKPLTAKEVEGHLLAHGYQYDHTTGSHRIWINPMTGHSVPVPMHGNRKLKQGTLIGIFNACNMPKPKR